MRLGEHNYSYTRKSTIGNALDFSKRSSFVREIMLERVFPTRIILPLKQHYGDECIPTVTVGEHVLIGQCIGIPKEGTFAVPIHSGISGNVTAIQNIRMPDGTSCKAVYIESDRKRTRHPSIVLPRIEVNISASSVRGIIRNAGIVGMGREGIPTIAKINRAKKAGVSELLVNILQSEPYEVGDLYIAGEYADYVVMGAIALAGACGANKIGICIPRNKKDEIDALQGAIERAKFEYPDFEVSFHFFKDLYPQGYYRLIARALYGKDISETDTLEDTCGAILLNCSTIYSCWDAISGNMPLINKIITVTDGDGNGHNVLAPIGTPVSELLNTVNGISETEDRIVLGSCLTGVVISDPDNTPIIKTTSAISVIRKRDIIVTKCIHCGRCSENCPMGINPGLVKALIDKGATKIAAKENVDECIACGLCSYVCPSGLDITSVVAGHAKSLKAKADNSFKDDAHHEEYISLGNVSLLEMYSEDSENEENSGKDQIVLPFEGGKTI